MDLVSHKYTTWVIFFAAIFSYVKNQPLNTISSSSSKCSSNSRITVTHCDTPNPQLHHIHFTWTIGWSYVFDRKSDEKYFIDSPRFSATTNDKIKWYLKLGPNSGVDENTCSLFPICISDSENRKVWYKYDVEVSDKERNFVENGSIKTFYDKPIGYDDFPIRSKQFYNDKMAISLNLTFFEETSNASQKLTVSKNKSSKTTPTSTTCKVSSNCTNRLPEIERNSVSVHSKFYRAEGTWPIGLYHFRLKNKKDYTLETQTFSAATINEFKWRLKLQPNNRPDENACKMWIHLSKKSKTEKVKAKFKIAILGLGQKEVWSYALASFLEKDGNKNGWYLDLPISDEYFFDDKLTISFEITFCEDFLSNASHHNVPEYNFTDNFASLLYKNREYPDVVLFVNETRHPAHKDVLSLRSPVFAEMFEHGMEKGKKMKRIDVTDLDDRVVEEMLRYIYTGKCENVTNLADGLLVAAQKYNLTGLKMICVDALSEKLSIDNAANTLLLAEKNGVDELKSNAVRFIASNYNEVSETRDWKRIVKTNHRFVHNVFSMPSSIER